MHIPTEFVLNAVANLGTVQTKFPFVQVNGFTPNNHGWTRVGRISSILTDVTGRRFTFEFGNTRSLFIEVLGPRAYRLRFSPSDAPAYDHETTSSVVSRDLGLTRLNLQTSGANSDLFVIRTGELDINVSLNQFSVSVLRNGQLIHRDQPNQGLMYIPGAEVVAVMKSAAAGAKYLGLGEKAGSQLFKNEFTYTFFNFDNYAYSSGPSLGTSGPLNPTVPLYCSIPFLIEWNPFPSDAFSGNPYAYGIFLDNTGQSFVNVQANDYSDMSGKYYLGALYNELDYYFMAGDTIDEVLSQYTTLTGRASMPPRYVFGFHQGAYGYYDATKVQAVADAYRLSKIPCDGLHIDVDFQDNYRTFTHSESKFPDVANFFTRLHASGFKLSTNVTPLITENTLGETGSVTPYTQRDALVAASALLTDSRFSAAPVNDLYNGGLNYGSNLGSNPYKEAYPPLTVNRNGVIPLSARGYYPDFGRAAARHVWGEQYAHLMNVVGMDMIWQDMTCPAIDANLSWGLQQDKSFPGDLLLTQEATDEAGNVVEKKLPAAKVHNSYAINLLRATHDGLARLRPNLRSFIISRGGYAGMQRYAALWTGDSASSWDFLRINIPEVLNLGLSGVVMSGSDIGGFCKGPADNLNTTLPDTTVQGEKFHSAVVTGAITNYELLTRWMQLGSFLPWYRNHYDGYNKGFQEPYAYGEPVPTNCRKYVELRYRMIQIYYDLMYQWTQSGMPIVRPLFLADPFDPKVYNHSSDQFFVGSDFLVAPILAPHETAQPPSSPIREVYLPAGSDWYAFMDNRSPIGAAVRGGRAHNYYAPLDLVPIYVRAGAILPFCELEQWVGQLQSNPLTINFYPGPDRITDDRAYLLYQDDGLSNGAKSGEYRTSKIYHSTKIQGGRVERTVRLSRLHDRYTPKERFYYLAIIGSITTPIGVSKDGQEIPNVADPDALSIQNQHAWYWNADLQIAFAKIFDDQLNTSITFRY